MSRALLSVPFLYALSALTLCSVLCVVVSCLSFSFSTRPQLTRWWVDALFFFAFCLPLFCLLFALSTCFRFLLLTSLPSSLSFSTRQLLSSTNSAMLFCLRLYNVWMFVMRLYPSTLTCLMLCLYLCCCCCSPNPDLLLSNVVVFHKLVYIYIMYVNVS